MEQTKTKLPISWESIKLGAFVENEKGKKPKRQSKDQTEEFTLPYVDIEAFEDGNIKSWTDGDGCRLCYESDFLMVWDGSRSGLVGKGIKGALGSTLVRINFPGMNNQYAYYFLLSKYQEINTRAKGSGTPHVDPDLLWNYDFPIAPLNEQKRIVAKIEELFSELDNGIAALKTAREQLKVYRQAILKHAFEGKLTAKWREENPDKLEPPEQLLARIQKERDARYQQQLEAWKVTIKEWEIKGKEGRKPDKPKQLSSPIVPSNDEIDNLPKVPSGFTYTYLANIGDLGRGKSKHRPRNDTKLFGGKYPFIQTGEVKAANRKIISFEQTYSDFGLEQSKLWPVGTLCITIAANIAETAFLAFDGCFPDSVVGFSAYDSVLPEYVELFIKAVRIRIEAYAPATAQKNINLTTLENLVIPYCSLDEQKKIVDELESQFSVIDKNETEIEQALKTAEALRQSILKKAFSGKLVLQDQNDEPASNLLKRVKTEKAAQAIKISNKKRQTKDTCHD
ncbi:TPA: restriction endonuclease subunit S [Legionella pneumophila]|nr:restriction endonuclease subunit S [Legionella pneumophila]